MTIPGLEFLFPHSLLLMKFQMYSEESRRATEERREEIRKLRKTEIVKGIGKQARQKKESEQNDRQFFIINMFVQVKSIEK